MSRKGQRWRSLGVDDILSSPCSREQKPQRVFDCRRADGLAVAREHLLFGDDSRAGARPSRRKPEPNEPHRLLRAAAARTGDAGEGHGKIRLQEPFRALCHRRRALGRDRALRRQNFLWNTQDAMLHRIVVADDPTPEDGARAGNCRNRIPHAAARARLRRRTRHLLLCQDLYQFLRRRHVASFSL